MARQHIGMRNAQRPPCCCPRWRPPIAMRGTKWHKTTLALAKVALIWMEMLPLFPIIAGVFGAAGIALAAAGAHAAPRAGLDSAANILLCHALAILGGTALLLQGMLSRQLALIALAAWVLGTILFSTDVALRAFVGQRLFPMAAPTGGIILILAWLVLAAAALKKAFDHSA